ncbi:bifunctional hydroxymethylpyrimidine kinase/phosphomethylpyrimidine kinase [Alteribacter natronophilus]|uniref:bifunctional hydroxymethylpyrimidine kinase/phosphomethylpyrimidine kinase n=1 Tax=Alteribacter natronophilus TaxID=2583810 RepID=UPI00110E2B11|nr:bifunctional hydroxymethylpyrimidine kinase/phosphomethylpyrimidine kinase [Alteribacter natronophilus]TMW73042.1 bifunctional hydroxymethylpyrimidine kinase/phosphomethylpyrimidine kinase [Alteribacter natronophilus]
MQKTALTIAGSDSGGGAGIQADLKTFQEHLVFGTSALTAVTAQNTAGVQGVYPVETEGLKKQLESVGSDFQVDAVKTGMLFDAERIEAVVSAIRQYNWKNIVVDPVMIAKGGDKLLNDEAHTALIERLLPVTDVITPNIPEAEVLTGMEIRTLSERKKAAETLYKAGASNVVIKGGHAESSGSDSVIDLLFDGSTFTSFELPRIPSKNTHGTGCTFAAAITSRLALGHPVKEAVRHAKVYVQLAIKYTSPLGSGHGPTHHGAHRQFPDKGVELMEEVRQWED